MIRRTFWRRLSDLGIAVTLFAGGCYVVLNAPGALSMFGPVLAVAGCVFLITAVSE